MENHICQPHILEFQLNVSGVGQGTKQRGSWTRMELAHVWRFHQMASRCKKWLYMAKVRTTLLYPVSPWASLPHGQQHLIQMIQNKALNFIEGYRWDEFKLPDSHQWPTLGTVLHNQNCRILDTLRLSHQQLVEQYQREGLLRRLHFRNVFQSSYCQHLRQRITAPL